MAMKLRKLILDVWTDGVPIGRLAPVIVPAQVAMVGNL